MFSILLNNTDKKIYNQLKVNHTPPFAFFEPHHLNTPLPTSPHLTTTDPFIIAQEFVPHYDLTVDSFGSYLDSYVTLFQSNPCLQLCWYLIQHPYSRLCTLERTLYFSTSTIQRQLNLLATFLRPYQLQISFTHDPVIKGCELQIRWLAWLLSFIFDPPFDWFDSHELFQRAKEIQQLRIRSGQTLNQYPTEQLCYAPEFPYLMSEKGWEYLVKQFVGLVLPAQPLDASTIFSFFKSEEAFFKLYQKQLITSQTTGLKPCIVTKKEQVI